MDDNAQVPSVSTQANATPTVQPVSAQSDATHQQNIPVVAPQTAVRPVEPPKKQEQVTTSVHPEQGPVSVMEVTDDDDDDRDDRQVAPQEVSNIKISSHPEVILPEKVKASL